MHRTKQTILPENNRNPNLIKVMHNMHTFQLGYSIKHSGQYQCSPQETVWQHGESPTSCHIFSCDQCSCAILSKTTNTHLTYFDLLLNSHVTFIIAHNAVCDVCCIKCSLFWTCVFHNINSGCNLDIRHF